MIFHCGSRAHGVIPGCSATASARSFSSGSSSLEVANQPPWVRRRGAELSDFLPRGGSAGTLIDGTLLALQPRLPPGDTLHCSYLAVCNSRSDPSIVPPLLPKANASLFLHPRPLQLTACLNLHSAS